MARRIKTRFSNRIRFNWGYHDGASAYLSGHDNATNFGFVPRLDDDGNTFTSPQDVANRHIDREFSRGWLMGWLDAQNGKYEHNSDRAWELAVAVGVVEEGYPKLVARKKKKRDD